MYSFGWCYKIDIFKIHSDPKRFVTPTLHNLVSIHDDRNVWQIIPTNCHMSCYIIVSSTIFCIGARVHLCLHFSCSPGDNKMNKNTMPKILYACYPYNAHLTSFIVALNLMGRATKIELLLYCVQKWKRVVRSFVRKVGCWKYWVIIPLICFRHKSQFHMFGGLNIYEIGLNIHVFKTCSPNINRKWLFMYVLQNMLLMCPPFYYLKKKQGVLWMLVESNTNKLFNAIIQKTIQN